MHWPFGTEVIVHEVHATPTQKTKTQKMVFGQSLPEHKTVGSARVHHPPAVINKWGKDDKNRDKEDGKPLSNILGP